MFVLFTTGKVRLVATINIQEEEGKGLMHKFQRTLGKISC